MSADSQLSAVIQRLEAAALRLETLAKINTQDCTTTSAATTDSTGLSPALTAFDTLLNGQFKTFLALSKTLGGIVHEQSQVVSDATKAQRHLIQVASLSKKPDTATTQELIKPLQQSLAKVTELKDKNRPSPLFFHLSTVADGIGALGWVVVEPAPAPYINELKDAAQFYANRVIKENKDKDKTHVEWVSAYVGFITELGAYVKQWHTTGLAWNPRGGDAKSAAVPASSAAAAPPPPPMPTSAQLEAFAPKESKVASSGATSSLFSAINKGNVTAGLRKVDKAEMTHKNPELRATSVVKASDTHATRSATFSGVSSTGPIRGPAKLALEGKKWIVENQIGQKNLVIEGVELQHVVYIYNCHDSTIQIKGKANAVTVDGCKKTGVVLENVLSTVDIINSKSVQVQITGKAPILVVDKTDGFQVYLSKESEDAEIFTAKSSEMNVLIQGADGEYVERAIPEQFKTVFKNGALSTVAVEHKG
ncbi:suppressor of rasval19 [Batrachochytrium dendrobatidis]|nr:suppressor of rasval19 [Batrachochytrium dendrobatidis]KAK5669222.1 suppressor of rasval19 [Batrachochytrium dendrobatidis]